MNDGRGPASPLSGLAGPFACAGSRERAPRHRAYSRASAAGSTPSSTASSSRASTPRCEGSPAGFGLTLDDVNVYPPHTRARDYRFRFDGRFWPQAALDREWHDWGFRLFYDAAFSKAPWPTLHDKQHGVGRRWDQTPAPEWIEQHIPGGLGSDFGRLCVAVLLDEYGGPVAEQSALNLVYLLGTDDSVPSGKQPTQPPATVGHRREVAHPRGQRSAHPGARSAGCPAGAVHLGQRLEAVRSRGHGGYTCTFSCGAGLP